MTSLDLSPNYLPIERALAVQWFVESDALGFQIILKDKPLTRRGILSTVSWIYDPLGMAAPFLLIGNKILQDLCKESWVGTKRSLMNTVPTGRMGKASYPCWNSSAWLDASSLRTSAG